MMVAQAQAEVSAGAALTGDARREWATELSMAYFDLAEVQARRDDIALAAATLRRGAVAVRDVNPTASEFMQRGADQFAIYEKPLPVIQSMFGYLPGRATPTGPIANPPLGSVALIVFVHKDCTLECYPTYAILRRLIDAYGTKGLTVMLVTQTLGWDSERLIPSAKEEGELIRHFFYDEVHIPASLAVWESSFTRDASDGSVRMTVQPNLEQFSYQSVLVDRHGIVRQLVDISQDTDQRTRHIIEELLAQ